MNISIEGRTVVVTAVGHVLHVGVNGVRMTAVGADGVAVARVDTFDPGEDVSNEADLQVSVDQWVKPRSARTVVPVTTVTVGSRVARFAVVGTG